MSEWIAKLNSHKIHMFALYLKDNYIHPYSLNAVEWKSTLLGVLLGLLHFGVEIHAQNSGIHSKVVPIEPVG